MIEAKAEEYIENPTASTVSIGDHFALFGIPNDHDQTREYQIPACSHSDPIMTNTEWVSQAFAEKGPDLFGRALYNAYDGFPGT